MPKYAPARRAPAAPQVVPAPWRSFVAACRKCGKRLDGGFGPDGDETLRRAVKHALRQAGRRGTLHVVETGCLSLCPKGGVAVLRADQPGELHVVPAGLDGPVLLAALGAAPALPEATTSDASGAAASGAAPGPRTGAEEPRPPGS